MQSWLLHRSLMAPTLNQVLFSRPQPQVYRKIQHRTISALQPEESIVPEKLDPNLGLRYNIYIALLVINIETGSGDSSDWRTGHTQLI
mgnify:CR=1 FL=1